MHIVRIDTRLTHGWQLRCLDGWSMLFSDHVWGGEDIAKVAAEATKAALAPFEEHPARVPSPHIYVRQGARGLVLACWRMRDGKQQATSVSVEKWGVRPAITRALDYVGFTGEQRERLERDLRRRCGRGG